jgi:hypothetical protein
LRSKAAKAAKFSRATLGGLAHPGNHRPSLATFRQNAAHPLLDGPTNLEILDSSVQLSGKDFL